MALLTLDSFKLAKYSLAFKKPFVSAKVNLTHRDGYLLTIKTSDGQMGIGELAPLPGVSVESLEEAVKQVRFFLKEEGLGPMGTSIDQLTPWALRLDSFNLYPSVQWCLESAVLNLLSQYHRQPIYQMFGKVELKDIPLIGLISLKGDPFQEMQQMINQGFRHFKIKVGTTSLEQDVLMIHRLTEILSKNQMGAGTCCVNHPIRLRLDANRCWSLSEAIDFGKKIKGCPVEYIEEPFAVSLEDVSAIQHFYALTKISIALDESLVKITPQQWTKNMEKNLLAINALVLKPTQLNGFFKTLEWIKAAKLLNIKAVISSCFESGVGLSMLAQLSVLNDCLPTGLDTLKYFKEDILNRSLNFNQGQVILSEPYVDMNSLNLSLLLKGEE